MSFGIERRSTLISIIFMCTSLLTAFVAVRAEVSLWFETEPESVTAVRGRPTSLHCVANTTTSPAAAAELYWIKDGSRIKYDTRRYQLPNGTLYITSIEHSRSHRPDEGLYQCAARLASHGTIISRPANITIAYTETSFLIEPKDVTVTSAGDVAAFACLLRGAPTPTTLWFRDSESLSGDRGQYSIVDIGGESVLEIRRVGPNDVGRYRCQTGNGVDQPRNSRFARLNLNTSTNADRRGVTPQFIVKPRDQTMIEGKSLLLYCAANGRDRHNALPTIVWLKDGTLLDLDADDRLVVYGQGTLIIANVTGRDAGVYTCRATNAEDSIDAVAYVTVLVGPRFRQKLHDVTARVHSDVTLECDVDPVTPVSIEWRKNGDVVIASNYFSIDDVGRQLRILGLEASDAGMYQCLATNQLGTIQSAARLSVLAKVDAFDASETSTLVNVRPKPGSPTLSTRAVAVGGSSDVIGQPAPRDLTATIASSSSVYLSWLAPDSVHVEGYIVWWREVGSQRERSLNTTSTAVTITQLRASTQYSFHVAAVSDTQQHSDAATIAVKTPDEDALAGVPTNVRATAVSPTSIHVRWDAPESSQTATLYYRLYYYDVGDVSGGNVEMDVTSIERDVTVTDLCKYCEYSLRVVAYTADGPSESSDEVTCRTLSDVPSSPPHNVTLEPTSSTSIAVTWEPPAEGTQNGLITGYKLRYKPRGERTNGEIVMTDGTKRSHELTGLERATEYTVRVQALTVNGSGPATQWLNAETFAHDLDETAVPGKPTSLRVRPLATSLVVSWTPPVEQNIMIRGYVLGYGVGIPDVYRQILTPRQRYHTVKALRPSSEYVISLRAYNNVGEGIPIYETTVTREESTPEPPVPLMPPVGVHANVLTSTSIAVSWSDALTSSPIDGIVYTVRCGQRSLRGRYRYINVTSLSARVDDLRPDTEYELSVKMSRGARQSTWSMSVFVRTKEAVPSSSPRDVTPAVVDRRPSSVVLSWQPPRHTNGQITGYLIYYTTDSTRRDADWVIESVNGDRLSATVRDLRPDMTHYFKVAARNKVGYGPVSPTVIFHTPRADGTGGGMIETPDDQRKPGDVDWQLDSWLSTPPNKDGNTVGGLPTFLMWVIVGGIGGLLVVMTIIIAAAIVCCRRRQTTTTKPNDKLEDTGAAKPGPRDVNPPDLWIHGTVLEVDKMSDIDDTASSIQRPSSRGNHSDRTVSGGRTYDYVPDDDRYSSIRQPPIPLTPTLHDPLASPPGSVVDSLGQRSSISQASYQRLQSLHYASAPRVNIADIGFPSTSSKLGRPTGIVNTFKATSPPPTAAAVIFTSRPPPSSPRRFPSTSTYAAEFTPLTHNIDAYNISEDVNCEELKTEIAGIEGLMKDLSAITQRQLDI